jgi:hypothetical protein
MNPPPDRTAAVPPLTIWEKRIIAAFIERYPGSAAAAVDAAADTAGESVSTTAVDAVAGNDPAETVPSPKAPRPLRLKPDRIVPGIDRASPDDRESFLEAAESLEGRGLLSLVWARHRKGETLSALVCRDPELLYELTGKNSPKTTAEDVRGVARTLAAGAFPEEAALFSFLAENFTPLDAAGGIDVTAITDLARLTRFLFDRNDPDRGKVRGLTTRALSTALYSDSKRLEALMTLFNPLFIRARRQGIGLPDFSFLDRSFPETFIAGKIALDFADDSAGEICRAGNGETSRIGDDTTVRPPENAAEDSPPCGLTPSINAGAAASPPCPLVNAMGSILGLPLETILRIRRIRPLAGEAAVLTIENKETFFALSQASPALPGYACFLYVGGHPNRAVRTLVSLLVESGFTFSHAGDLDPDGILILQELAEIAGKAVKPLRMDTDTFDAYLECGRPLEPSVLKRTALIGEKARSIPGMAELIRRIEETGMGVEQEIIDYRG